jgi:hypothetical protein
MLVVIQGTQPGTHPREIVSSRASTGMIVTVPN